MPKRKTTKRKTTKRKTKKKVIRRKVRRNPEYKLYLDDLRIPKTKDWVVVRSCEEFQDYINKNGMPYKMSLDHDLGDNVPTGYDCVKWLVYDKEADLRNIDINIHSANPVGKRNMEGLINSWNKFLDDSE